MGPDFSSLWLKAEHSLRFMAAYAVVFTFVALDIADLNTELFYSVRPDLTLIAIFYWSIYRPTLTPNWLVFLLGLIVDALNNMPLGLNALIYVLVNWIISDQRRVFVGQPFFVVMLGFAFVLAASHLMRWSFFGLLSFHWPDPMPLLVSYALGLFLFPVASIILHMVHKILPQQDTMWSSESLK